MALVQLALSAALALASVAPAQEQEWRRLIRTTLFISDPLPPLAAQVHGQFEPEPGVIAERVTYGTQFGLRVPAILYRPKSPKGKIPALIVVNGHGGDKYAWYAFYTGVLYARAGAAVLTYDPAGEGERNIGRQSGTRAHDKIEPPAELAQRLAGLMVTDLMQAVSYLRERPEVDPARIAATGYSLGSFVVAIAGAVDTRLRACIPVGGGNLDGPGEYWDGTKPMCVGTPYRALMKLGDRPAVIYALHAARGLTLVFNGTADDVVAIPTHLEPFFEGVRERVARLRGMREGIFETGWEPGTSHRPYFVTRPVVLWLERQLDLPNWSEQQIRSMSETHISEWAAAGGVPLDPMYATEIREGGTRALGTRVPALTRDQLSVFSLEEWTRRKAGMIHETWLQQAKALIPASPAVYEIRRATSPITIDARLNEPAWQRASTVGDFHFNSWTKGEKEPTDARLLWDDDNLYVSWFCEDKHISSSVTQRHGPVSNDDCVEIFLSPNPAKVRNYYTFEINAIGAMLNRCRTDWWSGPPTREPEGVRYRASYHGVAAKSESLDDQSWAVELAIPFRNFAPDAAHVPPKPGDTWRLNLFRTGGITNKQSSSWAPIPPPSRTFHTPEAFGEVRFVDRR